MPQIGWLCVFSGEEKDFRECIDCSKSDSHCEFTPEMLLLMSKGSRGKRDPHKPSVTKLLASCLRKVVIEDRYDYRVSPRRSWFLFRGNMIHSILEGATIFDGWKETYMSREVILPDGDKAVVGGVTDKVVIDKKLIRDYKTARRLPTRNTGAFGNHALQLNIYRWIWWDIFHAEKLRLQYIDMGGTKQMKVDLMPIEEVEELVATRAMAYRDALTGAEIPVGEYNPKDWQCRYCDISSICKSLNEEGKDGGNRVEKRQRRRVR